MLLCHFTVLAQTNNCAGYTPPQYCNNGDCYFTGWPPNTTVTVYVDPNGYSADQQAALEQAFTNWQNTNETGVTFSFSPSPVSGDNTFTVTKAVSGNASSVPFSADPNSGQTLSATSYINPNVTGLDDLTKEMAPVLVDWPAAKKDLSW
jgi:hypothetical protein